MKIKHLLLILIFICIQILIKDVWLFAYKTHTIDYFHISEKYNILSSLIFCFSALLLIFITPITIIVLIYKVCIIIDNNTNIKLFLNKKIL